MRSNKRDEYVRLKESSQILKIIYMVVWRIWLLFFYVQSNEKEDTMKKDYGYMYA